jgi:pseudouridine kinase
VKILVAGSANIDVVGLSDKRLIVYGNNKGKVMIKDGGTARNIAANSIELGLPVSLLTAVGEDEMGRNLLANMIEMGASTIPSTRIAGAQTPINIKLIDNDRALYNNVYSEPLSKLLRVNYVKKVTADRYDILLADTSLGEDVLRYFTSFVQIKERILIPAFGEEVDELTEMMCKFNTLIVDADSAELSTKMFVRGVQDAKDCARHLLTLGFRNVFILMDERGVVAADSINVLHVPSFKAQHYGSQAAWDGFAAGIVYTSANNLPIFQKALFAMAAYAQAARCEFSNEKFSLDTVGNILLNGEKNEELTEEE